MSSLNNRFAWPYRRPSDSPFGPLSQWSIAYGRSPAELLISELPGWDAGSHCVCSRTIALDFDELCSACGLDPDHAELKLAVTAETAGGRLKQLVWERIIDRRTSDSLTIRIEFGAVDSPGLLGPGVLVSDLTLRTGVYLHSAPGRSSALTASRPGSMLWTDAHKIDLEGPEAVVPIMPISFKKTFMGIDAPDADFYIALEAVRDASSQFRSSVMVYANIDTRFEQRLADAEPRAIADVYVGLVTQLCMHLLLNDMLTDSEDSSEQGTVGSVAESALDAAFPGRSIATVAQILRARPAEFMVRIQDWAVRATKGLF